MTHNPETVERVAFLRQLHSNLCYEQGDHELEVDTAYSAGADAIERLAALSALPPQEARPSPKVRKLVWHNGESKGGGAKYNMYEVRDGLFNCVVYPYEDTQYRIAEKVSEAKAIEAANADYEARILGALA